MISLFLAYGAALLGTSISLLNFHLSVTRPLVHRRLHPSVPYKFVSGFPLFGSLLLWVASLIFWSSGQLGFALAAIAISALDTGGIHWFIVSMCIQALRPKQ